MPDFIKKVEDYLREEAKNTLLTAKTERTNCIKLLASWFVFNTTIALIMCRLIRAGELFNYYAIIAVAFTVLVSRYSCLYFKGSASFEVRFIRFGWLAVWLSTVVVIATVIIVTPWQVGIITLGELFAGFLYTPWIKCIVAVKGLENFIYNKRFDFTDDISLKEIYSEAKGDAEKALKIYIGRYYKKKD